MATNPPTPSHRPESRSRRWGLLAVVLIIVAGLAAWWWTRGQHMGENAASQAAPRVGGPGNASGPGGPGARRFGGGNMGPQPVSTAHVRRQDIRVTSTAIGSIAASNTAIVRAQVSGVLQRIAFTEGQQVKAGQVLAEIDPRSFQAALGLVQGQLARDVAQLDNARVDLARYKDLVAKDAAPRQQYDTQMALVHQLEGTVKADQASVDSAKLQLSYTKVTAPISGRAGLKQVDLGNIVGSSDANGIVTIAQTHPIALTFSVPSVQLPQIMARLRAGDPLPVEARDRSGATRLAVGKVATVDNAIDATTDTIKIKALFPNEDDALFPNQAVTVRLQLNTLKDVLTVPQAAVLRGAQGFYVYVVNEDKSVASRVVKPGAAEGDWVAVDGQLQPGEEVVIDGTDRLREGSKVEVIAADPRQRQGASAPAGGSRRRRDGASGPREGAAQAPHEGASSAWRERMRERRAAGEGGQGGPGAQGTPGGEGSQNGGRRAPPQP